MKKLVSVLVVLSMLVACFATTALAANSPVGDMSLTVVTAVETEGGNLSDAAREQLRKEYKLNPVKDDWVTPIKTTAGIEEKVGVKNYNLFQGGDIVLSQNGKDILSGKTVLRSAAPTVATINATTGATIKTITLTLNVPGLTEANAPKIVSYDPAAKTYTAVTTTVAGSSVSATVPVDAESTAHVAVIYTKTATSPETNVAAWVIGAVAIVALAGAVYAGKKVFAA